MTDPSNNPHISLWHSVQCALLASLSLSPAVYRKSEYSMCALYSKKKGVSLTRKPSFTTRPFLHQYEVKGTVTTAHIYTSSLILPHSL